MLLRSISGRIIGISTVLASIVLSLVLFASQPAYAVVVGGGSGCIITTSDMMITKVAPATATVGGTITYQLTVTNNGSDAATNVIISDTLPSGTTFASSNIQLISGTAASGSSSSTPPVGGTGTLTSTATTWPNGTSYAIQIVVNANQGGVITNTATVTADCDPNLANNSSSASTNVSQPQATSVPTMNEWGMIIFVASAGILSLYYFSRRRKA